MVRSSATDPSTSPGQLSAADRKLSAETIGQRLLRLLEPLRVLTLSLHDGDGELLYLSEGVFGPDEHCFVLDALDLFVIEPARRHLERTLEDGRRAVFICARNPLGERCGVVMAVGESRSSFQGELLTPALTKVMRQFSMLLAPPIAATPAAMSAAGVRTKRPAAASAVAPRTRSGDGDKQAAAPRAAAASASTPRPATPGPEPRSSNHSGTAPSANLGPVRARRYVRLRTGGSTRRYEVVRPAGTDDLTLSLRVIDYLQHTRERYQQQPASFTVPLSAQSIGSDAFIQELKPALQRARLADGLLGFLLPAAAWSHQRERTQSFIVQCAALHCFVALDDFTLGRSGFALLRSSALRSLKFDAELIGTAMNDKFSQATVFALIQAARVLGLYCIAKGVDGASQAQWLATAGIEFSDVRANAATTKDEVMTLEQAPPPA